MIIFEQPPHPGLGSAVNRMFYSASWATIPFLLTQVTTVYADEGMWLLNDPPRKLLLDKYGFELTDAWLERARLASVRFNNGGSGGFVSSGGLIATNHHIGADSLQKLGTKDKDLLRDGFYSPTRAHAMKCPHPELNVLRELEGVP